MYTQNYVRMVNITGLVPLTLEEVEFLSNKETQSL